MKLFGLACKEDWEEARSGLMISAEVDAYSVMSKSLLALLNLREGKKVSIEELEVLNEEGYLCELIENLRDGEKETKQWIAELEKLELLKDISNWLQEEEISFLKPLDNVD